MNYTDLDTQERKEVRKDSGYSNKELKEKNPYFIKSYELGEELLEQFCDIYGLLSEAQIYVDTEALERDWGMDYTEVTINGTNYQFRSF